MRYNGKELFEFSLWDLGVIEKSLKDAEAKREEASKHPKFTTGIDNKKAMEFPPPNPEFLKLKLAVEQEIRNKQNA